MDLHQLDESVPDEVDVVVVGASTSGLMSALRLAEGGLRVAVLERKASLELPRRTWIVTSHFKEVLRALPASVRVHTTSHIDLYAGPRSACVPLDPPDYIVDRSSLLAHLADRATDRGVLLFPRTRVEGVERQSEALVVSTTDLCSGAGASIRTRYLIGADGNRSTVARAFGGKGFPSVPVVQAVVKLPADYDPANAAVWFDRGLTRFFFWLIPDSAETGVLGFVAESPANARPILDSFARARGFHPLEFQGAMIPLHRPGHTIEWGPRESRVLLVGDAAGHVKVTTVGGVVSGLWGAQAAADSILRGTSYSSEVAGLERELLLHDVIRWAMDRFDDEAYEQMLDMLGPRLLNFLGRRTRDTMFGAVHRLVLAQPRLILLGLRALIGGRRVPSVERAVLAGPRILPSPAPTPGDLGL